ncbi:MAG: AMP-binding protein [Rikenellaceae bacterium]
MFECLIKNHPSPAVHYGEKSYSYEQLLKHVHLYANHYETNCTAEKIERVMLFSKNTPDYIFALYGAIRLGATSVPVDAQSTPHELEYMINDARPQIIYASEEQTAFVEERVADIQQKFDADYAPLVVNPSMVDASGVDELSADEIMRGDMEDVVTIIYTSGTTGSPKGVMLTYSNLWYNVNAVVNDNKILGAGSRNLMILPINHIFSYAGAMMAPLYGGAEIYICENLTPDCIISTLQKGRITVMLGVPRLYEGFVKGIMAQINKSVVTRAIYKVCAAINSAWLSKRVFKAVHDKFGGHIEFFVSGGAALPIETAKVLKALGLYVLEGYGMTECAPMIAFTRPGERAVGYCGRILEGCEHKIVENDEIIVRGANVMKGYYGREEETAAVIRDGWLYTGDTATYDERKGLRITGRIKEILVTPNGKNINPALVENEITQSSVIIKELALVIHEDILQAIVYPDMNAVRADTKGELDDLVRGEIEEYNKTAAGYKRIMRYHIISEELPKTRLGKTKRHELSKYIGEQKEIEREDISDRSACFKALKAFVDEQTDKYANGDSHFEIDLALDSLGRISLLSFVEEQFGVVIGEDRLADMPTLNKLSAYIEEFTQNDDEADGEAIESTTNWNDILSSVDESTKPLKSGFTHWFCTRMMRLGFSLYYGLHFKGRKSIPSAPVLFVCNHRSGFDGGFVISGLKWGCVKRSYFFAKDKHFEGSLLRWVASKNNVILMNINSNVRESMQQMYRYLNQGGNIVIFPEGTRYKDGKTRKFKESFAILSSVLDIPVVPVAISGSERATRSKLRLMQLGQRIDVSYLPAMKINEGESTRDFAQRVEEAIVGALRDVE